MYYIDVSGYFDKGQRRKGGKGVSAPGPIAGLDDSEYFTLTHAEYIDKLVHSEVNDKESHV